MTRRKNWQIWAGFTLAILALVTYIPLFVPFPITRDVPWVNLLLFAAAGWLLVSGLMRAVRQPEVYRGKVTGIVFSALSFLMLALFCFGTFVAGKWIPSAATALALGQPAPAFTLSSQDGKQVVLSDLLKDHRGVVLVFYRGYW